MFFMFQKIIFPGQYIQGSGTLQKLPEFISNFGKKGAILASPTSANKILPKHAPSSVTADNVMLTFNGESTEKEIQRVVDSINQNNIDVLVGMGGGKTIDTAKIAADRTNTPVIIIPTIASSDAPCSGVAVIYTEDGIFESICFQKKSPAIVLVDTNVITESPVRFLISGMGDALATWLEASGCYRTQSLNDCGGHHTLAGMSIAKLCYETLFKYGKLAAIANENHLITPAFEHIVEANILLSGVGFESCGVAAAHAIHNGLTALDETHAYYHGEKVAFGALAGLHLTDAEPDIMNEIYEFCELIGLPTTFKDIGITNLDRDYLMKVAIKTCEPQESIHKEAGEITPEKVLNAMLHANAYGEYFKS
jgi:glycerol dehydrogenase